jgi:uncharacterized protein
MSRKTRWILGLALLYALLLPVKSVLAVTFPEPVGFVNDFAGLLSTGVKADLEQQLVQLEKDTGAELAVVTVASLDGLTVEDYAVRLFEKWQIGKKGKDNGVLFLTAVQERKVRIEVGYGLESVITDSRATRILDEYVVPKFRDNNWEEGINGGVKGITVYVRAVAEGGPTSEEDGEGILEGIIGIVLFGLGIMLFSYVVGFMSRTKSWWLGGVLGAVAGAGFGFIVGGWVLLVVLAAIFGAFGTGMDYLMSRNYQARRAAGKDTRWGKSGGGFWGGGWGGGSGGGGFGGFGGGSSGGGGGSRGF